MRRDATIRGMAISMVLPIPVGDALRVFWSVPAGTQKTRVLRKGSATFTGPDDSDALVVFEGEGGSVVDIAIANGQTAYYLDYHFNGATWAAGGAPMSGMPATSYGDQSVDVLSIVRERLAAGLLYEVEAGRLVHREGVIPVLTAPPAFEDTTFPLVTVHLQSETPTDRYLGEQLYTDMQEDGGNWAEAEGWMAQSSIQIIGWELNADARVDLRKAIRRIIVGNLAVFDSLGIVNVDLQFSDAEDLQSYNAPVYQVMGTLNCKAPVLVTAEADDITDVTLSVTTPQEA